MSHGSSVRRAPRQFLGSSICRVGQVPVRTLWRSMRLTITDEGVTLQPKNGLQRVLLAALRVPVVTARWDAVKSVTMVRGRMAAPRKGLLFQMSNPAESFVFTSWRRNETVLEAVAEHWVLVTRGPVQFNAWRSTSWQGRREV